MGVSSGYHDLQRVFSKAKATSLPPHCPYDGAVHLLPGTVPPQGRLYSLSEPQREALEEYYNKSLEAGIMCPSSDGAGFFFVEKNTKSLWPCIDYYGLNDITVKTGTVSRLSSLRSSCFRKRHCSASWFWSTAYCRTC